MTYYKIINATVYLPKNDASKKHRNHPAKDNTWKIYVALKITINAITLILTAIIRLSVIKGLKSKFSAKKGHLDKKKIVLFRTLSRSCSHQEITTYQQEWEEYYYPPHPAPTPWESSHQHRTYTARASPARRNLKCSLQERPINLPGSCAWTCRVSEVSRAADVSERGSPAIIIHQPKQPH